MSATAHTATTTVYPSGRHSVTCSCGIMFTGHNPEGRQADHAAGRTPELDDLSSLLSSVAQMREGD
jgi:hypothetical protein